MSHYYAGKLTKKHPGELNVLATKIKSPKKGKLFSLLILCIIEFAIFSGVWIYFTMATYSITITFVGIGLSFGSVMFQYFFLTALMKKDNKQKRHKETLDIEGF